MMHHSILGKDDGVILGASSAEQMEENVAACERGPLPQDVAEVFEQSWNRFHGAGYSQHYSIPLP
jgi:aflatoxin B1 aldehyde reductase